MRTVWVTDEGVRVILHVVVVENNYRNLVLDDETGKRVMTNLIPVPSSKQVVKLIHQVWREKYNDGRIEWPLPLNYIKNLK